MTKKHIEAIANILAGEKAKMGKHFVGASAISLTAQALADYIATQNPRFDRERFLRAAGVMQ